MKVENGNLERKSHQINGNVITDDIIKDTKDSIWTTDSSQELVVDTKNRPAKVRLPLRQRGCYGIGHVYNDLCSSMWFTYTLLYYHMVLGFSNSQAGLLVLIGQVADAVSTPFIGLASDKRNSLQICRYGRRKIWHLIGTICVTVSFPFLFISCLGCQYTVHSMQMIYYASFIILFQFGWAAVQVAHLSLIPDLTKNPNEKTELSAYRNAFTVLSSICVYGITWAVLGNSAETTIGPEDADDFRDIVLIVTGIGLVFSVIFHFGVSEPPPPPKITSFQQNAPHTVENGQNGNVAMPDQASAEQLNAARPMKWKQWLKSVEFYKIGLLYMCTRLFGNLSQTYISLYLQESLKLPKNSVAYIPLVVYVSGFLASLFMKLLNKKAGRLTSYVMGALIGIGFCIWIYFGNGFTYITYQIYGVAILMGASGSIILVTCLGITADLIGDNVQSGAFVFGAMSFADKLSNGVVVVIVQNVYKEDTWFYRDVLAFGCGIPIIIALITVFTVNKSLPNDTVESTTNNNVVVTVTTVTNLNNKHEEQNGHVNHGMINEHIENVRF